MRSVKRADILAVGEGGDLLSVIIHRPIDGSVKRCAKCSCFDNCETKIIILKLHVCRFSVDKNLPIS